MFLIMVKRLMVVVFLASAGWVGCARTEKAESGVGPTLDEAWQYFRLAEYDLAARDFTRILTAAGPGSEEHLRALFGLANVWNLRRPGEDLAKARAYYQQIITEAPAHELTPWCELALIRLQHVVPVGQEPDYPVVRKAYQALIERHPGHLAAKEATIYLNATLIATLDEAMTWQAVSNLQAFITSGSSEFVAPAYSLLAVGYTTLKKPDLRLQSEIKAFERVEIDPANPFNEFAWAYWNIGTIAEFEVGDFDLARQYYRRLIEEYPVDIRTFPAQQALARMDAVEAALREGRVYQP
jgi:tetratricopeptide (TPR) repeat protein